MNFEDIQKSWQSQNAARGASINMDALLHEVRHKQRCFRRTIFWRDVREVGVAALLVPIFIHGGLTNHWTLHLCAFGCFVVGAFMLLDRWRQKRATSESYSTLKDCATASLAEVNHQIWLLKNIAWWYLLPLGLPMLVFFASVTLVRQASLFSGVLVLLPLAGFLVALYAGIYWLNQWTVRKNLQPKQKELEALLAALESPTPPPMNIKRPLGPLLLVVAAIIISVLAHAAFGSDSPGVGARPFSEADGIPALAVIVTKDGQICDRSAKGIRKWGDPTMVTTNDVFHIGSCTKSMTATLAAIFIEEGKLRWDTTIGEMFPELKGTMDKRYEAVTVEQLLHHRGGVPRNPPSAAWARAWKEIGTPTEQRFEFIKAVLAARPEAEPGTKMIYSNQGYAIVGAMLEKIAGRDFESLMEEKLFKPLGMETAGFGPPGGKDKTDQPWGHESRFGRIMPKQSDNPPVLSPAGRVHCSLEDLARYAMFHLQTGSNALLKAETMTRLHATPVGADIKNPMEDYACGWVRLKRGWGGGTVLWHNGSNTMWYIVMWLAPEKNFSVIAATNIAGRNAEKACDQACVDMIHKWLPE